MPHVDRAGKEARAPEGAPPEAGLPDFDGWAQMGCRGWSYDDVLPYFMRAIEAGRAMPSFSIRSTVSTKPSASQVSKGPSSQL